MHNSAQTRGRLRSAALDLFMSKGVTETTTREIAAAAGIAEGTIYRHYPSKEALACDLMREVVERVGRAVDAAAAAAEGAHDKLVAAVSAYCREADKDWTGFIYMTMHGDAIVTRLEPAASHTPDEVLRGILRRGMDDGTVPRRDLDLATAWVRGLVLETARARFASSLGGTMAENADAIATAAWRVAGERDKQPEKSLLRSLFGRVG